MPSPRTPTFTPPTALLPHRTLTSPTTSPLYQTTFHRPRICRPTTATTPKATATQPPQTPTTDKPFPEFFYNLLGSWQGEYFSVNPLTQKLTPEAITGVIEAGIRGDKYSQRNSYTPHGTTDTIVREFKGYMRGDEFILESPKLVGFGRVMGGDTLVYYADLLKKDSHFVEVVRWLQDDYRTRTWTVYEGGQCVKIVHVKETRVSRDDVYFEIEDLASLRED